MVSATQRRLRIAILTVGIATFLFSLLFPGWARHKYKKDHDEAAPQQAVVTVDQVIPPSTNPMSGQPEPANVRVQFRGESRPAREIRDLPRLHAGSEARIVYRLGKSGRVYIDSVEPMKP